ncbi:hypothetical protein FRC07_005814 [Ceratobasidium sp. 392]|nr:hypothetical protein FRC07_005814 [Ceratobasidium sp. 392]
MSSSAVSPAPDDATTDSSMSRGCSNPERRKEWRKFNSNEKAAYIAAVQCLMRRPHSRNLAPQYPRTGIPPVDSTSSYYDDLVYIHMDQTDHIHYTGWYVNEHVTQLRNQCRYTGVMPYWDWSQDASAFNRSAIFDPNPTSGLGGFGNPNLDYKVTNGGFANMTLSYPIKHNIRRNYTLYPYLDWFWLQRPNEAANTTITQKFVNNAINGYVGDFIGFQNATEKAQAFHANIHMMMGGDMAGTCPTGAGSSCTPGSTFTSNDPLFFLHHANIDRIWYLWQSKDRRNAQAFKGGSVSTYTDPAYPNGYEPWLDVNKDYLPVSGMGNNKMSIYSMLSTTGATGGPLCYVYE